MHMDHWVTVALFIDHVKMRNAFVIHISDISIVVYCQNDQLEIKWDFNRTKIGIASIMC